MRAESHIESQLQFTQEECRWCLQPSTSTIGTEWCDPEAEPSGLLAGSYLQHIDEIVDSYHSPVLIMYDDLQVLHDDEQCLKRIYSLDEYSNKIRMLSEYYKFHNEVPRLFMLSIAETLDNYIDERRQLEYVKVTNILKKDQPEEKKKPSKYEPIQKLLDSIDLSYDDFEKRGEKKKQPKLKTKKVLKGCGNVQKGNRVHIQSIEQRVRQRNASGQISHQTAKQSSKKKLDLPPTPTIVQNENTKSCKGLLRQRSRGVLDIVTHAHRQPMATHKVEENHAQPSGQETHRVLQPQKKLSTHSIKRSTSKPKLTIYKQVQNNDKEQPTDLARLRCNSRPLLKPSAVPLKTIDMNKLGGSGRLNLQPSKTSLHNVSKIEKKPQATIDSNARKTSIHSRDNSKQSKKVGFSSASSTQQLQQSQHSNSSNPPSKRNIENMFSSVLAMKKHRTLGISQQQSS